MYRVAADIVYVLSKSVEVTSDDIYIESCEESAIVDGVRYEEVSVNSDNVDVVEEFYSQHIPLEKLLDILQEYCKFDKQHHISGRSDKEITKICESAVGWKVDDVYSEQ